MSSKSRRHIPSLSDLQLLFREAAEQDAGGAAPAAGEQGDPTGGSAGGPRAGDSNAGQAAPHQSLLEQQFGQQNVFSNGDTSTASLPSAQLPQHDGIQPPLSARQDGNGMPVQRSSGLDAAPSMLRRSSHAWSSSRASSFSGKLDMLGGKMEMLGAGGGSCPTPQFPLQEYGPKVAALLQRRCASAQALLAQLQVPMPSVAGAPPKPRLPSAALRFCKGLAFMKQRKAGLLGGWTWGDALVILRLPDGGWSAPIFLRLRFASLGLTAGAQRTRSVYVLQVRWQGWVAGARWSFHFCSEATEWTVWAALQAGARAALCYALGCSVRGRQ